MHLLMIQTFSLAAAFVSNVERCLCKNDWQVHHVSLPILLIGGEDDPVIQNKKSFMKQSASYNLWVM